MRTTSSERTAFQEAGHILLHLLTGIKIIEDNIIKNDKQFNGGIHDIYDLLLYDNNDSGDYTIMCLRASSLAEKLYCLIKNITYDPQMSGNDIWQTSRLYYEMEHKFRGYESFEKHIRGLEEETEKLIKMHWSFVLNIAQQLLIKKKLTVEEIIDLGKHF